MVPGQTRGLRCEPESGSRGPRINHESYAHTARQGPRSSTQGFFLWIDPHLTAYHAEAQKHHAGILASGKADANKAMDI